jgi:glycine/D-amino acid oxidase-like deaminating enzyme
VSMRVGVIGAGVVGLATTVALLRRGVDVTCFERAGAPMTGASSACARVDRLLREVFRVPAGAFGSVAQSW